MKDEGEIISITPITTTATTATTATTVTATARLNARFVVTELGREIERSSNLGLGHVAGGGQRLGNAKVAQLDAAVVEEDVGGLDVAVKDLPVVQVLQCQRHFGQYCPHPLPSVTWRVRWWW